MKLLLSYRLTNSFDTNYVLNKHGDFNQYGLYAVPSKPIPHYSDLASLVNQNEIPIESTYYRAHMALIITLVRHKKNMVRRQNAWFDTKKPGSTQNWPPQHASVDIAIIKHTPPVRNIFFQFYSNSLFFKNQWRNENEIILIWIQN